MFNINDKIDIDIEKTSEELKKKFAECCKNEKFNKIAKALNTQDAYLNIAEINQMILEQENCEACINIKDCPNVIKGHCYELYSENSHILEQYVMCEKCQALEYLSNIYLYGKKVQDIEVKGEFYRNSARVAVIEYINKILTDFDLTQKGIYLHGSFGTGKSYIMNILVKRLAENGVKCGIVYYPELLLQIRQGFNTQNEVLDKIKTLDALIIDDLGAEKMTTWSRDEVLGTILQYRMDNNLFTCFTSNYTVEELTQHLNADKDLVSANRIIDRIKYLTVQFKLTGENYRK